MFPVITGEPDALSLTTKLEQNVLERERETEREIRICGNAQQCKNKEPYSRAVVSLLSGPDLSCRR